MSADTGGRPKKKKAPKSSSTNPYAALFQDDGEGGTKIDIAGIMGLLDSKNNEAKAANEGRYNEAKGVIGSAYDQAMGIYDTTGATAEADTRREYANNEAGFTQDAISRGTYNTSLLDALKMRNQESLSRAVGATREQFAQGKAGIAERRGQATSGLIASRVDEYPDPTPYISLVGEYQKQQAAKQARKQEIDDQYETVGGTYSSPYGAGRGVVYEPQRRVRRSAFA